MAIPRLRTLPAAVLLITLAACSSNPAAAPATPSAPAAASIAVTIDPPASTMDACQSVPFKGAVTGTVNQGIAWSVKEGQASGTVSPAGVYTAPTTAGTYHVVAASVADPSRTAESAVVVGPEKVLALDVAPGSASVSASGALAFSAVVTTSCGSFPAQ